MTRKLLFIFALPFALITTLAYGQVFLGNVFRLGTSTDAAKPAASATNKGGLLFISDGDAGTGVAGSIAYSNGSSWLPVLGGSSGSTNFWYDAGSGNIFAQEAIYNPDGGVNIRLSSGVGSNFLANQPATAVAISTPSYPTVGLGFGSSGSGAQLQGMPYAFNPVDNQYAFAVVNSDTTYGAPGLLLWNQSNGGGFGQAPVGAAFVTGTAGNTTYYGKLTAGGTSFGYATGITVSVQPARNFGFRNDNTGTLWWTTEANTGEFNFVGVTSGNDAIQLSNGARVHLGGGTNDYLYSDGTTVNVPVSMKANAGSSTNAFEVATTGARVDLGAGSNDYAVSDGTGIETPSYWESTLGFASGAGVIAPRVQASGGALTAFTAAAATSGGVGTMAWDSTTGSMKVQQTASSFAPIAQPHIIFEGQTFSTRVASVEVNTTPQIAERVNVTNTATLQMYWTYTAGSSGTQNGRSVYALLAGAGTIQYGMTANSVATTAIQRITHSGLNPTFCQRVRTDVVTNAGLYAGLASVIPVTGGSGAQTGHFAYLYGDVGSVAFWQLCTRDGTTTGCTNTNAALAASTDYTLCLRLSTTSCDAFVNGVYVGSRSTNLPASGTGIAPVVAIEAVGASKTLYVGPMQVQTQ